MAFGFSGMARPKMQTPQSGSYKVAHSGPVNTKYADQLQSQALADKNRGGRFKQFVRGMYKNANPGSGKLRSLY